jgi:predicted house-cleaning noncanonical NTP pyrophosphatase (MazG superfamily)
MKQKYIELAQKILEGNVSISERVILEDQLIEMVYQIALSYDLKPEEFDVLMSEKRTKNGLLKPVGDIKAWFRNKLIEESKKTESVEKIGDILEIVETYTARF